jgi:hypothetical protein
MPDRAPTETTKLDRSGFVTQARPAELVATLVRARMAETGTAST